MDPRPSSREKAPHTVPNGRGGKSSAEPHDGIGRNASKTALEESFAKAERNLSSGRRRLISDILQNSEDTYFLSSRELAQRYGVDEVLLLGGNQ